VVSWCNEDYSEAVYIRNKALMKVRRSNTFNDLINYKKSTSKSEACNKKSKEKYWR